MKLWRHECCRVFADKLTTLEDKAAFLKELDKQTAAVGRAVIDSPEARTLCPSMMLRELCSHVILVCHSPSKWFI